MNITLTKSPAAALSRILAATAAVGILVASIGAAYELGHRAGAQELDRLNNAYTRCQQTGGRWQEGPELFQCYPAEAAR